MILKLILGRFSICVVMIEDAFFPPVEELPQRLQNGLPIVKPLVLNRHFVEILIKAAVVTFVDAVTGGSGEIVERFGVVKNAGKHDDGDVVVANRIARSILVFTTSSSSSSSSTTTAAATVG